MRRRAYLIFSDINSIKINTIYKAQQSFDIAAIPKNGCIDLIALNILDGTNDSSFYAKLYDAYGDGYWELHTNSLATTEDLARIEKSAHTLVVFGVVDSYGKKEAIGFVTVGETKSFEVYVP